MKQNYLKLLCLTLILVIGISTHKAYAYDIAVKNEDGVTIYYNYFNNGTELEVTYSSLGVEQGIFYKSMGYQGITSIIIPESVTYQNRDRKVTSIGEYSFSLCKSLTSVTIPNSVTSIGQRAFLGSGIISIDIPNSITTISHSVFANCKKLVSVNLSSSLTEIGDNSFSYCDDLPFISIPDNIERIGSQAFRECKKLNTISIGKNVSAIMTDAFYKCESLSKVIIKDIAKWCNIYFAEPYMMNSFPTSNPLAYSHRIFSDEETEIVDLVIPTGVTNIVDKAFYSCTSLKSVSIPKSLKTVGSSAFYECTSLEKVIVKNIKEWCNISFTTYDSQPLYYARHLYRDSSTEIKELNIPTGVPVIRERTFLNCSGLNTVNFSNTISTIKDDAFYGCDSLSSISLGFNIEKIGKEAFMNCALTSVQIPNGTKIIDDYAFYGCDSLKSLVLGRGLTSIGTQAFICQNLHEIVSYIKEPFKVIGRNSKNKDKGTFSDNAYFNADIYVPHGSLELYKKTEGWKDFVWIQESPAELGLESVSSDNTEKSMEVSRYKSSGEIISFPQKGINIIRYSDGTTKKVIVK